jgi:alpha-galactosidase
MRNLFIVFFSFLFITGYGQKFDLAKTPPMGWNSWNRFACDINEDLIKQTADAMVSTGMKDAGYTYVNIDDCWHGKRDSLGFIHPDPIRFPHGMKALADYVHSKGLKIGIYSDAGKQTCGGHPGSRGHEYQDAITYAQWGIDYLKFDWCNTDGLKADESYKTMRNAIYAAKHPMVFSICEWGTSKPWTWAGDVGHLWRTTGDIYPCWNCEYGHGSWISNGVLRILDMQKDLRKYAGPGHWNDPDMLEVGNGMSNNEDRAHFSLWCMLAAPLIAGNDLRTIQKETLDILTNKEVIAVDQDSLGIECFTLYDYGNWQIYFKPLKNGDAAICFLNRGETIQKVEFNWKSNNVYDGDNNISFDFNKNTYKLRDLWAKKDIGTTNDIFKAEIPTHDVILIRLSK